MGASPQQGDYGGDTSTAEIARNVPPLAALVIPYTPLAIAPDEAVSLLRTRVLRGQAIRRRRLIPGNAERSILRWHEENVGVIEGMFEVPDETESPSPQVYRSGLWDLLDSEIRQLSALRERISVQALRREAPPAAAGGSSAYDAEPARSGGGTAGFPSSGEQFPGPGGAAGDPGAGASRPPAPPRRSATAEADPDELADADLDLPGLASGSADRSALRRIAIAKAASATLPAYDADAASTRDFIGIDAVADAFSYLLASKSAQPPLAIGLFGEWGSGKSFLMQEIRRRIDEITRAARDSDRRPADIGVYKRVVQIEFNAWHYVEGNLWASLVDHIFANLRVMPGEPVSVLNDRRTEISKRMVSTTSHRRVLQKQIETLDEKHQQAEEKAAEVRERQLGRLQDLQRIKLSDVAAAAKLDDTEKQAVNEALSQLGLEQVEDSVGAAAQSLSEARTLVHRGGAILAPMRGRGVPWLIGIVVAICLAPAVAFALQKWNVSAVPKVLTSLAATASVAIALFQQGMKWVSGALTRIEKADAQIRARVDAEAEEQAKEIAELEQAIREDERQLTQVQQRLHHVDEQMEALKREFNELTPRKILTEFLDQRASSLDYQRHLGLTALIRKDFEKLTALVAENAESDAGGSPSAAAAADFSRVVLFVDDLDRCPPRRVVEVLQAVHLLLSFPVFAVVVAVDPRWLARSLQLQYEGLIEGRSSSEDASTAQDYLEKIFQIPYRVAPLDSRSRARFMSGLVSRLVSEPAADDTFSPADGVPLPGPAAGGTATDEPVPRVNDAVQVINSESVSPLPDAAYDQPQYDDPDTVEVDLNPSSLQLDDNEITFLGELLPILDSSPRGLKRYINIYRLIKAVAAERSPSVTGEAQRRMFLLAVLTSFANGSDLITFIIDSPSPCRQTLGDRIADYLGNRPPGGPYHAQSEALTQWLSRETLIAACPVADALDDARHVRLYSFT